MDIKWKNSISVAVWLLLFSYGLNGVISGLDKASEYSKQDYFHTQQFEAELDQFVMYLSMYELNETVKEDLKRKVTVTEDEVNEHRYRYGDLSQQIANIKSQYEDRIQEAIATKNKEVADALTLERDKKITDINQNFTSDDHVRAKIVKEKEKKIDDYFRQVENYRSEFARYKTAFLYYLKDTQSGKVHTNVNVTNTSSSTDVFSQQDTLYIRNYPSSTFDFLTVGRGYNYIGFDEVVSPLLEGETRTFEGQIAVPQNSAYSSTILANYYEFQQKQIIFYIYTIGAILALIISILVVKRTQLIGSAITLTEKWQPYYNRIPVDIRITVLGFTGLLLLVFLLKNSALYYYETVYSAIENKLIDLVMTAVVLGLALVQGKFLLTRYKKGENLREDWQKSIFSRSFQMGKDMFLNRRVGTQVILLLMMVFAFGAGAIICIVENEFAVVYIPAFVVIGLPLLFFIMRRIGYFNRIIANVNELAKGNYEPDLPVNGKSVLAIHAANINTLKQGVNVSRKEQAKSERLKTELITNVSHDLRTPLTSIITYTELLKSPDLTSEDREAYVQIIDRKSKRLKVLIDDLFEASKMASGSIELVKEKVDVVQLLQQALAEHNETVSESTLHFRVTKPDTPIFAIVDGQKMWRVFDNLIGNILKYSLENTRVYISVKTQQDQVIISFKNVTKYELGEDIDELFERFKRGDTSRHTDGSGLGLAIAKSIVDLHDGNMEIEVDGDLFKVTITLKARFQ